MSDEAKKLRDKAAHARWLRASMTDARASDALQILATEFEQKAAESESEAIAILGRGMRQKAEELRTMADQMQSPSARQSFVRMAETYDRMAEGFEMRARNEKTNKTQTG